MKELEINIMIGVLVNKSPLGCVSDDIVMDEKNVAIANRVGVL